MNAQTMQIQAILPWAQFWFYLIIGVTSVVTLILTKSHHGFLAKQNKLLYRPVIGVTKIDTFRVVINSALKEPNLTAIENVKGGRVKFHIENVGNLAAKGFKVEVRGKIDDTWLPFTENYPNSKGIPILPKMAVFANADFDRAVIERMRQGEKLIYHIHISYHDWEEHPQDDYDQKIHIRIASETPFNLEATPIPE